MTTWLRGDDFPFKADSRSICEYDNGKVWIAGARDGNLLMYSVRQWKDGVTVWSAPKNVSVDAPESTVQVFISDKDGYVQFQCGNQNWYIDPRTIDEISAPIEVCQTPYHETGKLLIFSGTMLAGMALRERPGFSEAELPGYYNALAADGINAERNLSGWVDNEAPPWESLRPWTDRLDRPNEEYYRQFDRRMKLVAERRLTEIITVGPYDGYSLRHDPYFPAYVREFVRRTKKWLPYIVYETWNEPGGQNAGADEAEASLQMVKILQEEGVPNAHIQISYCDSSVMFMTLQVTLRGEGLACLHWVGSMETITISNEHGQAWEGSPGTALLMENGLYASNDGEDTQRASRGLNWWHREQMGCREYLRPDNDQLYEVTKWMLSRGRGYEHLSAAGFQSTETPVLADAIEIGRAERRAGLSRTLRGYRSTD
jgi:hypothetical protein